MKIAILDITMEKSCDEFLELLIKMFVSNEYNIKLFVLKQNNNKYDSCLSVEYLEKEIVSLNANCNCLKTIWKSRNNKKYIINLFDDCYKMIENENYDALVIKMADKNIMNLISKSLIQLSPVPVLFLVKSDIFTDQRKLIYKLRRLEKFRNIHIGIQGRLKGLNEKSNLHFFLDNVENVLTVLTNKQPNKRRFIGWRHSYNELRQKIKFNKDLIKHWMLVKFMKKNKDLYDNKRSMPKLIHYCWFGGNEMPNEVKSCIRSWKNVLPDYEFKLWDENNFPFEKYYFAQEALKYKKWTFIADVARLHALYYEGGIYLDTDVEVLKPFDIFLDSDGFTSYESLNLLGMGTIGFKKYHPWVSLMLSWYSCVHCDSDYTEIANTKIVSKITKLHYGVKLNGDKLTLPGGVQVYPREYFSPELVEGNYKITEKTCCIHHFTGLW